MRREDSAAQGLLLVDKPLGWTSHDAVAWVRRTLGTRKVGHAGTLDPLATGLLVVCVGACTKLVELLTGREKTYAAVVRFGATSATGDAEGPLQLGGDEVPPPETLLESVRRQMTDWQTTYDQMPPKFSAKKVDGESAHRLARAGREVALKTKRVALHDWAIVAAGESQLRPLTPCPGGQFDLHLTMRVGSGFYVRSLAHDLGEAVGCGAYLVALRRDTVGSFTAGDSIAPTCFDGEADELRAALEELASSGSGERSDSPLRKQGHRFPQPTDDDTARCRAALMPPDAAAGDIAALPVADQTAIEIDAGRLASVPWVNALGPAPSAGTPVWLGAATSDFRALGECDSATNVRVTRRLTPVQRAWSDWQSRLSANRAAAQTELPKGSDNA